MSIRARAKRGATVAVAVLSAVVLSPTMSPNAHASSAVARQDAADQGACAQPAGQKALGRASAAVASHTASLSRARQAERATAARPGRERAALTAAKSRVANASTRLSAARKELSTIRAAQTRKPVVFFTQNLDFATGPTEDKPVLDRLCAAGADFLMVQEAKNLTLSSLISPVLSTNQNTAVPALSGSAVIWRKPTASYPRARVQAPSSTGLSLGVDATTYRVSMLNRYISYVDTRVDGVRTRVISAHWAPARYSQTWSAYIVSMRAVIASRPKGSQWIIGADFNQRFSQVGRELHARSYGTGIIGFVVSDGLSVSRHTLVPYATLTGASDHPAYRIAVTAR